MCVLLLCLMIVLHSVINSDAVQLGFTVYPSHGCSDSLTVDPTGQFSLFSLSRYVVVANSIIICDFEFFTRPDLFCILTLSL